MDTQGSIGGLIPLWILGAPFLLALFELFTTPQSSHRRGRDGDAAARPTYASDTGPVPRTPASGRL